VDYPPRPPLTALPRSLLIPSWISAFRGLLLRGWRKIKGERGKRRGNGREERGKGRGRGPQFALVNPGYTSLM